jgi:flagellar biosynthesis/type III secretory pathway M-ring protein FliF/YscJ
VRNTIGTVIVIAVAVAPFVALAASEEQPEQTSLLWSLFWSLVPILFIALLIWFFFVRGIRNYQRPIIERDRQHKERVEQLLERIARALEKDDKGGV